MEVLGVKYGLKLLSGHLFFYSGFRLSGGLHSTMGLWEVSVPTYVLLCALFGGVFLSSGIGITTKAGCNTCGRDIISHSIAHYAPLPVGAFSFSWVHLLLGLGLFHRTLSDTSLHNRYGILVLYGELR